MLESEKTKSSNQKGNVEKTVMIPVSQLVDFKNHPFKVRDDEEMQLMAKTIMEDGITMPLLVRKKDDGKYEIISGHRRKFASEMVDLKEVPCIVRDLTDDEAIIQMVTSNIQREKILSSEKAFAYKMLLEAEKRQGSRNDLTCVRFGHKLEHKKTRQVIAERLGESATNIYRYIRLTELIPELLKLVDEERIAFSPAVDISYLTKDEQKVLFDIYERDDVTPNVSQSIYLKKLSQVGNLSKEKIEEIMDEPKANQRERIKLDYDKFRRIIPKSIQTEKQVEDFLFKCVIEHNQREEKRKSHVR